MAAAADALAAPISGMSPEQLLAEREILRCEAERQRTRQAGLVLVVSPCTR